MDNDDDDVHVATLRWERASEAVDDAERMLTKAKATRYLEHHAYKCAVAARRERRASAAAGIRLVSGGAND
jgi:Arc/MetJ family transcription regulator